LVKEYAVQNCDKKDNKRQKHLEIKIAKPTSKAQEKVASHALQKFLKK
jgi:hypothetical protein